MTNVSKPLAVVEQTIGAALFPNKTIWKAADLPTDVLGNRIPPWRLGTIANCEDGSQAVFAKAAAAIKGGNAACNITTLGTALPDATPTFVLGSNVVTFASTAHGQATGTQLLIVNQDTATQNGLLNGIWTITSTGANSFTIVLDTPGTSSAAGTAITAASGNAKPYVYTMAASGGTYISPGADLASGDFAWFIKRVA